MVKKISREDEAELPVFNGHAEAREWFIAKYGDAFVLADSFFVGEDSILYRYDLVLD